MNKFTEWIDQWISETKGFILDLREYKEKRYQRDEEKISEIEKIEDALKKRFSTLLNQYATTLNQFSSNTAEIEKREPKNRAIQEIVYAAIDVLYQIPYYYSDPEEDLLSGFQEYLLYVRSVINSHWENPTSSILNLDLDPVIQKYLFYHNGVATIGQLQKAVKSEERLFMIGSSRMVKIHKALLLYQANQNSRDEIKVEKQENLQSNAFGVWTRATNEKPEVYIELNAGQALTVERYCSVQILPDGTVLAKLADC